MKYIFVLIFYISLYPFFGIAQADQNNNTPEYGNCTGMVRTEYGEPVPNKEVHIIAISGDSYFVVATTKTDSYGKWFIKQIPAGTYATWVGPLPSVIGGSQKKEIIAGETTNFGTHIFTDIFDPTPKELAKKDATPHPVGSSPIMLNGCYVSGVKNGYYYLKFYEDGTAKFFYDNRQLVGKINGILENRPNLGGWGTFKVDGSHVNFIYEKDDRKNILKCIIMENGQKIDCTYNEIIGDDYNLQKQMIMSFFENMEASYNSPVKKEK